MFKLTYRTKENKDVSKTELFNNIGDLYKTLTTIINDPEEEDKAIAWCKRAQVGDKVIRQHYNYKLECIKDTEELIKKAEENQDSKKYKNGFIEFIVGNTYQGRCDKTQHIMKITVTNKTQHYIFYETETGIKGKAMIKYVLGCEAVLIKKVYNLTVYATDRCK